MASDFWIVLQWWGVLFLVGAVAFALTKRLFAGWWDEGYFFSKAVGMAVVTWIVYVAGTGHLLPFTPLTISIALFLVFIGGVALSVFGSQVSDFGQSVFSQSVTDKRKTDKLSAENRQQKTDYWISTVLIIILEELFFFLALLFWSWVKGHEPSIRGLEKFMDFGFMQSILNSRFFPPADMWYAGSSINYYYFGHMVVAVLNKLSGLDLAYTFNLMLATIFALTLTMSFSIGYQLMFMCHSRESGNPVKTKDGSPIRSGMTKILAGLLTAFLVTLAGNMQTMYAFTRGYTGDNVKPFWELFWPIGEFWQKLPEGMRTYWYANATRFIPFTIHEFPSYSFVVSDVHGHVLSLPFVLLAIALLVQIVIRDKQQVISNTKNSFHFSLLTSHFSLIFYGFLVGVLLMTNALDGPIYFALLGAVLIIQNSKFKIKNWEWWKEKGMILFIVAIVAVVTSVPFLIHFKSFVNGLALNCPPAFLANSRFGPLIFEGVEKCQRSALWMMALLWGFFLYCGIGLIYNYYNRHKNYNGYNRIQKILIIFFLFSLVLVIFPEFFYFKDIYPAHFRSNTMFKLGYQSFILFSIVAGYTIVKTAIGGTRRLFFIFLLPQLILVSIYPYFSVRSYFGELKEYKGLDGLAWFAKEYPDDWAGIRWLNGAISNKREVGSENQSKNTSFLSFISYRLSPVLVEADGDSYTDHNRFSTFTGIPTIVGWAVHEWLWRGSYDVVSPRREEVRKIYESTDINETKQILEKYHVRYIVVGTLEREKYKNLKEWKFIELGVEVHRSGNSVIYDVR